MNDDYRRWKSDSLYGQRRCPQVHQDVHHCVDLVVENFEGVPSETASPRTGLPIRKLKTLGKGGFRCVAPYVPFVVPTFTKYLKFVGGLRRSNSRRWQCCVQEALLVQSLKYELHLAPRAASKVTLRYKRDKLKILGKKT